MNKSDKYPEFYTADGTLRKCPYPLRKDLTAWVYIPDGLTKNEAKKLCKYIRAMVEPRYCPLCGEELGKGHPIHEIEPELEAEQVSSKKGENDNTRN